MEDQNKDATEEVAEVEVETTPEVETPEVSTDEVADTGETSVEA